MHPASLIMPTSLDTVAELSARVFFITFFPMFLGLAVILCWRGWKQLNKANADK